MTAIQRLRLLRESRLRLRPLWLERRGEQAVRHGPWLQRKKMCRVPPAPAHALEMPSRRLGRETRTTRLASSATLNISVTRQPPAPLASR